MILLITDPEWCSGLRQEVSLQSLVRIQAASHPAVIGSPIGWQAQRRPRLAGVGRHCLVK